MPRFIRQTNLFLLLTGIFRAGQQRMTSLKKYPSLYDLFIGQPDQFIIDTLDTRSGKSLQFSLKA